MKAALSAIFVILLQLPVQASTDRDEITIGNELEINSNKNYSMDFGKVKVGTIKEKPLFLKNDSNYVVNIDIHQNLGNGFSIVYSIIPLGPGDIRQMPAKFDASNLPKGDYLGYVQFTLKHPPQVENIISYYLKAKVVKH
jgi:hypothetical protein